MFAESFEKTAIGITGARKAVSGLKKHLIRRAQSIKHPSKTGGMLDMRTLGYSKRDVNIGPAIKGKLSKLSPEAKKTLYIESHHPKADLKIFAKKGIEKSIIKDTPVGRTIKKLNPKNKEMFNRTMLMHEGIERKYLKKQKTPGIAPGMHGDLGVILEEGNITSTLPKKYKPTKNILKRLRYSDGSATHIERAVPGYKYGKTRLSRHGIKNVRKILSKKGLDPVSFESQAKIMRGEKP